MIKKLIIFCILLLLPLSAIATDRYCDCSSPGTTNAAHDGTSGGGGLFVSKADIELNEDEFADGDDLYFLNGSECSGNIQLDITWDGDGPAVPWNGSDAVDWSIIGCYTSTDDFTCATKPIISINTTDGDYSAIKVTERDYIQVQDLSFKNTNGTWNCVDLLIDGCGATGINFDNATYAERNLHTFRVYRSDFLRFPHYSVVSTFAGPYSQVISNTAESAGNGFYHSGEQDNASTYFYAADNTCTDLLGYLPAGGSQLWQVIDGHCVAFGNFSYSLMENNTSILGWGNPFIIITVPKKTDPNSYKEYVRYNVARDNQSLIQKTAHGAFALTGGSLGDVGSPLSYGNLIYHNIFTQNSSDVIHWPSAQVGVKTIDLKPTSPHLNAIFNNTLYNMVRGGLGTRDGADRLFAFNNIVVLEDNDSTSLAFWFKEDVNNGTDFYVDYNLYWSNAGDPSDGPHWKADALGAKTWAEWQALAQTWDDNSPTPANPSLASAGSPNNEYTLNAGSPAIDTGTYISNVTQATTGTSITVTNPDLFHGNLGLKDINGDLIDGMLVTFCTGTNCSTNVSAEITSVNYSTSTITVTPSVTTIYDAGSPKDITVTTQISLRMSGDAPDIGAKETGYEDPPPEGCDVDPLVSGHWDYCLECDCDEGDGDCDSDDECDGALICDFQTGVDYCATAPTNIFYVDQDGSGGGGSYYSLAEVATGNDPFDDLDGDTVCFSGTLTSAGTYGIDFRNADNVGTSESWIVLDGSGEGDCTNADPATLTLSGADSYGIITNSGTGPSYMEIKGFTIRNTDTDIDSMGIYIRCADEGLCESVYIHDNDVQLYGGSAETLTVKGIYTDGAFNHLWVYSNTVIGLNQYAYDGIHLTQLTNDGDSTDIRAYDNTVNDWAHGNIAIALIGASGTGTITGAHIYGNTVNKYNRGYGQGVGFNAQTQYAADAFSEGYIHDNTILWNRAPNQMEGKNIAFYRNIIYNVRNVCPPAVPADFDARYAGQPAYFGDTDCQEEIVWDWSFELNGWGRGYSMLWNSGQGIVASLGYTQGNAYFQNTIYSTSEAAFQYRGGSNPTTDSNVKIVGNIFAENNILSTGNGWSNNSTSNTVCTAADEPYDWCTGENAGTTTDPYRTYTEDAGDSNPPGSKDTEADCPIWIGDIGPSDIVGFEIKDNVIYTAGDDKIFCHSDASIGEKLYTLIEAQGTGGTGDGDWGADELVILDNANSDPLMVDPASADFTLQSGSPAIDRGFWTTVETATSTTDEVEVTNALFLGAPGETIKTAAGVTGVIRSINYTTNVVTLVSAISVVNGEGIGLTYSGTSLDAGAIEYE